MERTRAERVGEGGTPSFIRGIYKISKKFRINKTQTFHKTIKNKRPV